MQRESFSSNKKPFMLIIYNDKSGMRDERDQKEKRKSQIENTNINNLT